MATRFNYVYGDNCALGKLFTWIAVAIFSAIYTGWIITYIPQVIDASSILQAWEVLRIPSWTSLIILSFFLYTQTGNSVVEKNEADADNNDVSQTVSGCCQNRKSSSVTASDVPSSEQTQAQCSNAACCAQGSKTTSQNNTKPSGNYEEKASSCCREQNKSANPACCSQNSRNADQDGCCGNGGVAGESTCCRTQDTDNIKQGAPIQSAEKRRAEDDSTPTPVQLNYKYTAIHEPGAVSREDGLLILYGTVTGTAKTFAEQLAQAVAILNTPVTVQCLENFDVDKLPSERRVCVFIISTYEHGTPPKNAEWFYTSLLDAVNDHRIKSDYLASLRYAVFGLGNSLYLENFNKVAKEIDIAISGLSGKRISPLCLGDENVANSNHGALERDYDEWQKALLKDIESGDRIYQLCEELSRFGNDGDGAFDDDDDFEATAGADEVDGGELNLDEEEDSGSHGVVDMEDMGDLMKKGASRRKMQEEAARSGKPREMITPNLRKALTKQGYRLIGTHSGVKLCRWTKSMLRGRGGCYKHTFYGIESHRCMETTPSLACANKCVFCWRHHTNPVGTEWRWQIDDPLLIINGAMQNHYDMIRQFKGAPGVVPERLQEANSIRHCALSLVGEPIMYPHINDFLDLLHSRGISSFLVTNAQFPDAMRNLRPCTQLYVSIDASSKDSLKKIDRPLFKDFWERFITSLQALSEKGQRTVYRLTIVKAWNSDEVDGYVQLVNLGKPDFIEVKGVTYCGSSQASNLTMSNVPYHEEVLKFVQQIVANLPDYELVCEHEHSNSVLAVNRKFLINGRWHTWIDYDKFLRLMDSGKSFNSLEYVAPTPEWAIIGHPQRGFDPVETRYRRNKPVEEQT
eukprot:gene2878-5704_t